MSKKSIGQFIAALRKANGMTQQNVADRLNVSNKAVSRWERDECAPDISLIPALAEMFGVTCDELLKGERILEKPTEKKEPKVEKQLRVLVNKTVSGFKTIAYISLSVSLVGFIIMLALSYGVFLPIIGFGIMLLLQVFSICALLLGIKKVNDVKQYNELFEMVDERSVSRLDKCVSSLSFAVFFIVFSLIVSSIPIIDSPFSVLSFNSYVNVFISFIVPLLLLCYVLARKAYGYFVIKERKENALCRNLTLIQISFVLLSCALFFIAPYFDEPDRTVPVVIIIIVLAILCLFANVISFAVFMIRNKEAQRSIAFTGVRNMMYIPCSTIFSFFHSSMWYDAGKRESLWNFKYLALSFAVFAFVTVVFDVIEGVIKRKSS